MTVATSSPAGQAIAANAHARRIAAVQEAKREAHASLVEQRADTTTPLAESAVPAPVTKPEPLIVLSMSIVYRGRNITITGEHMTLDQFCDMLDRRLGVAE